MTTSQKIQDGMLSEFELFGDWTDKYQHIIDLGKSLPPLPNKWKTDKWKVSGCQSNVWLYPELREGRLHFYADSDAIITKGLMALILRPVQDQLPEDIEKNNFDLIGKLGLKEHLSPTRANGLDAVVRMIRNYSKTFSK